VVDEKPHIQALERAQGYLRLPNGRALGGQAHDYKRHGTSTLFAALDLANGEAIARHYKRRRRIEFLDFMNRIVAAHPGREIHVVLDNLNTHKPKRDRWRARHKNVHFHYTPTHASWLNQNRMLVLDPRRTVAQGSELHRRRPAQEAHRRLRRKLQPNRPPLRLDQIRGPSEAPQTPFRGPVIPGTSLFPVARKQGTSVTRRAIHQRVSLGPPDQGRAALIKFQLRLVLATRDTLVSLWPPGSSLARGSAKFFSS
jgi:hypothetical protein